MQPIIAITVGEVINISTGKLWTPIVHGQFQTYTDAIVRVGGAPFIMPLVADKAVLRRLYEQSDGLLLSGGHDISQNAPKRSKSSKRFNVSPRRDKQEIQLLKWALADDKPVLGICRGLQLINVTLGGSLHHDINTNLSAAHNHEASIDLKDFHHLAHRLIIKPDSQLAAILRTKQIATNTLHHQSIQKLGDGLIATAQAEDGLIEAIEMPGRRFVIGVQSHPEALEAKTEPQWRKLFEAFVSSAMAAKQ
jgi:putative glutamine amidotransferase